MSILVDADKTIDKWCEKCYETARHFRHHFRYETIEQCRENSGCWLLKRMSEAVTVDAVPVVRCRDCKHRTKKSNGNYYWCSLHGRHTDDFFCADGERKEQSDDAY